MFHLNDAYLSHVYHLAALKQSADKPARVLIKINVKTI